jgi:hypothetical protein
MASSICFWLPADAFVLSKAKKGNERADSAWVLHENVPFNLT